MKSFKTLKEAKAEFENLTGIPHSDAGYNGDVRVWNRNRGRTASRLLKKPFVVCTKEEFEKLK